ncbi:MAG TPA: Asp-tRNA(Asn)/Glu-tRNA(Gln) amidotransferase subunit GatC [Acidobacteriota bacterium]|jgi:aspartyl-tRNA(Asn)/glutamyl-tRNA(Gln) amidotransferase subunit C|nr:Asp-tRNA(Asn)/Glu-tRNA(Gln) amidotransferase subunit GatC [Acidobacteriota bacterium]
MAISIDEVKHIAKLANLEFTEDQLEGFIVQFSNILDYIEQLRHVPTEGVAPTYHAVPFRIDSENARADHTRDSFPQQISLLNAPDAERGQFRVPKVIK